MNDHTARTRGGPGTGDLPSHPWFRRYPAAQFLVALMLASVTSPFTEDLKNGDLVEVVRFTIVLSSGLLAVGGRHRSLILAIVLVTAAIIGKWVDHWQPDLVPDWFFLVPGILFVAFVTGQFLRFIARAPRVDSEVLCAGISGYMLLGLLWALAYILAAQLIPGAFAMTTGTGPDHLMNGFTAIYFSFITLSTVGYGDIVPVSGVARMLAMMESSVGIFYTTMLIARLVTLYSSPPRPTERAIPADPDSRQTPPSGVRKMI
jgi:hypothetical protein